MMMVIVGMKVLDYQADIFMLTSKIYLHASNVFTELFQQKNNSFRSGMLIYPCNIISIMSWSIKRVPVKVVAHKKQNLLFA